MDLRTNSAMGLALVILAMSGSAWAQSPGEIHDMVSAAGHELLVGDDLAKMDAAALLGELKAEYCIEVLEMALSDPSAMVRMAVVDALGQIAHESSVTALLEAVEDENPLVALAAVASLGGMRTHDSYKAIISLVGTFEDEDMDDAVLEALRQYNQPHTPLPGPVALPEGYDVPDWKAEPGDLAPLVTTKKVQTATIDACNPYDPDSGLTQEECQAIALQIASQKPKTGIDTDNPYGPWSGIAFPAMGKQGGIDSKNPYDGPWTGDGNPPLAYIIEPTGELTPAPMGVTWPLPPPLSLEMWNLQSGSSVQFEVATASTQSRSGRMVTMQWSGEWVGKWIAAGAVIPYSGGGAPQSAGGGEKWHFGNIGLWFRHVGHKDVGPVQIHWGAGLTLNLPTGSRIAAPEDGTIDVDVLTAAGALYGQYYRHGLHYPDLENSFKAAVRPDLDVAMTAGPVTLQLELGFDFIGRGEGIDPDTSEMRSLGGVTMMHLAIGALARPLRWLQLSLELTNVYQLGGTSMQTRVFDRALLGTPAKNESFVTPGLAVMLPIRDHGSYHISLALRVPLGDVGSTSGPLGLGPILLMSMGFRFGNPSIFG